MHCNCFSNKAIGRVGGGRKVVRVAVVAGMLVALAGGGVGQALAADTFTARCLLRVQGMATILPPKTDVEALCRCQVAKLQAQGYDPDKFYDTAAGHAARMKGDTSGNSEAAAARAKMVQAHTAAFRACLPTPAMDGLQKALDNLAKRKAALQAGNQGGSTR